MKPVKLSLITDAFEAAMEDWRQLLNKQTGEIVSMRIDMLGVAEETDEDDDFAAYEAEERDEIKEARLLLAHEDDFIRLPDKWYIDDYSIMEQFAEEWKNPLISEKMCSAIHGRGAFRRFREITDWYGITEQWYQFKRQAMEELAKVWCEENDVPYEPEL